MAVSKQEKLFGAHEIQRFNRDADETIAWITEKDTLIRYVSGYYFWISSEVLKGKGVLS